jgi:hypothetical protein
MSNGSLAALVALGAFHGLNPAMGWLFAVARGLQERSRALVLQSLPAIAAGHAASVAIVAILVGLTRSVVATQTIAIAGGLVLVAFGLYRLLSQRHFRWVGMRISLWQLAGWSFLMSTAHGAGLMLLPVLTSVPAGTAHHGHTMSAAGGLSAGIFVTGVHTLAMFATAGLIAVLVYEVLGLTVLRRAWFNLDRLWATALITAGALTLITAV